MNYVLTCLLPRHTPMYFVYNLKFNIAAKFDWLYIANLVSAF